MVVVSDSVPAQLVHLPGKLSVCIDLIQRSASVLADLGIQRCMAHKSCMYIICILSADPSSAGGARPEAATEADSMLVSVVLGYTSSLQAFFLSVLDATFDIAALQTEAENWCT